MPNFAAIVQSVDPVLNRGPAVTARRTPAQLGVEAFQDVRGDLPDRLGADDREDVPGLVPDVGLPSRLLELLSLKPRLGSSPGATPGS
jgi:hypothetical protein